MHRVLHPRPHGYIDYAIVVVLFLAPSVFGFGGTAATLAYVLAVAQLGMSLITAYPLGVAKIIPFPVHGGIELAAGVVALIGPWLFGFSEVESARNFFVVAGLSVFVVWALTNYRAAERPRARRALHERQRV